MYVNELFSRSRSTLQDRPNSKYKIYKCLQLNIHNLNFEHLIGKL